MVVLGLDIGSSAVRAALLRNGKIVSEVARQAFSTTFTGVRAEVDPGAILRALSKATHDLGAAAGRADLVAMAVMAPAWVAMDRRGKPLTPIITHQDRRSVEVAKALEAKVGASRILSITGNRPFPGGISSTTCGHFIERFPALMRRADLVGHLSTFLHRTLTGERVIDTSNASFTGLYETVALGGWSEEMCAAVGISPALLPTVFEANEVAGHLTAEGARMLNLRAGTPMLAGMMDGSSALCLAGARDGQLANAAGSTDVLALCTHSPAPSPKLLTRALGIGRRWLSVSTLAAAGSSLTWAHETFFRDLSAEGFNRLVARIATALLKAPSKPNRARRPAAEAQHTDAARYFAPASAARETAPDPAALIFHPWLAGDRTSIEPRRAAFTGLTLASTREDLLRAVVDALAHSSAQRLELLRQNNGKVLREVLLTGGITGPLDRALHRHWPGTWRFKRLADATLLGLAAPISLPR